MLFNSFDFGLFLITIYLIYWALGNKNRVYQNALLLAGSYFFYGIWDWRFLGLLLASSLIDYGAALQIQSTSSKITKKTFLWLSITWNLGVLFVFKYYGFFVDNFTSLFYDDIYSNQYIFWNVIIPVGLSFYTFQTMSYTIDVYRERIKPTKNLLEFLCFVSFFPQLVAGPIERARSLLPQFKKDRVFDLEQSKDGLRQILWGLFKKMVVADNVAIAVNAIYASPDDFGSLSLLYASTLFFFQIYCDFSGYSDVAIGTAKLFGFKLSKNFDVPYLAKTVADYWQRWHITLTKWFTDYVYGPIVKNTSRSYAMKSVALFITMMLIGLWHGANWTFVMFGFIQAVFIALERIRVTIGKRSYSLAIGLNNAPFLVNLIYTSFIIIFSGIFFRAADIQSGFHIIERIWSFIPSDNFSLIIGAKILVIPILMIAEIMTRLKPFPLLKLQRHLNKPVRWVIYYTLIFLIIQYAGPKEQFIYFQF
ncbi:MBOAT family O-acyltransferase [Patiriisocius sp. Uisw_017]|jgi:alginate O-acetyltransferase complex protein AlgI|uniref:MBOAT family O-acyltransferase n=1 Tax=Patiriisocius sp. Uisw_017 TaxID=3230968 RepID=UPI0039ED2373